MKRLLLALLLGTAICGAALAQEKKSDEVLGPDKWPTTVKATVADLLVRIGEPGKETLRQTKKDDLIGFHIGWGMGIRNHYGLWRGNESLLEDACGKGCHPDDASGVIIEAVWQAVQDEKADKPPAVPGR